MPHSVSVSVQTGKDIMIVVQFLSLLLSISLCQSVTPQSYTALLSDYYQWRLETSPGSASFEGKHEWGEWNMYPSFHNECNPKEKYKFPGAPLVNNSEILIQYTNHYVITLGTTNWLSFATQPLFVVNLEYAHGAQFARTVHNISRERSILFISIIL